MTDNILYNARMTCTYKAFERFSYINNNNIIMVFAIAVHPIRELCVAMASPEDVL